MSAAHLSIEGTNRERPSERKCATQPATAAKLVSPCVGIHSRRSSGESMSFPWLTTIISCKVFAGSEITASLSPAGPSSLKRPQLQAEMNSAKSGGEVASLV